MPHCPTISGLHLASHTGSLFTKPCHQLPVMEINYQVHVQVVTTEANQASLASILYETVCEMQRVLVGSPVVNRRWNRCRMSAAMLRGHYMDVLWLTFWQQTLVCSHAYLRGAGCRTPLTFMLYAS